MSDRQRVESFSQRGASDCGGVDRIGLAGLSDGPSGGLSQPRRDADHSIPAGNQGGLQTTRHMPAVLDRPHPLIIKRGSEAQRVKRSFVAGQDRQLPAAGARCGVERYQRV